LEQDVGGGEECGFREEGTGEQADGQRALEERGDPGEEQRERKARRGDVTGRVVHAEELEDCRHDEDAAEDEAGDENCARMPRGYGGVRCHDRSCVDEMRGI
jgi:hypothetical protein